MIFADGLSGPEGPVLLPDGSWLVVEYGADRGCVTHLSADGSSRRSVARTGRPNGLALGGDGTVWVAESHPHPSLLALRLDGAYEVVATGCDGEPFLFPNDLCFGPDGALYMTDSGILLDAWAPGGNLREDYPELDIDGRVYRIDPSRRTAETLDAGLRFPNGVAFGDDGYLYVNEMIGGAVYRYRPTPANVPGREHFGDVNDAALDTGFGPHGFRGPDGMKLGADGSLYVTVFGQQDVTVLAADGSVSARLRTEGRLPTNLAFGPAGSKQIYVTEGEHGRIEVLDAPTDGARLF